MKEVRTEFEEIASFSALFKAWRTYRSGKRRRPEVAAFELDQEHELLALSDGLLEGSYRHGAYRLLPILDPKPRLIAVADVRDRVVHSSLHGCLAPHINRGFIHDSYACLEGRGSHRAVLRFQEFQRRFPWMVHLDIRGYFPSIEHRRLLALLEPRIRDSRTRGLIRLILDSGDVLYRRPEVRAFYGLEALTERSVAQGLPIGNLSSQWWGNVYLNGADHFIKRQLKVKGYLRYLDDLVLFGETRGDLRAWRRALRDWLLSERGLRLNPRKGHIRPTRLPQTYLGYRVTQQGIDLAGTAVRRFRKKLPGLRAGDPGRLERSLASWYGAITF